jgi:hypothetical protein
LRKIFWELDHIPHGSIAFVFNQFSCFFDKKKKGWGIFANVFLLYIQLIFIIFGGNICQNFAITKLKKEPYIEGIQLINENVKNFATFPWAKAFKDVHPIFPRKAIITLDSTLLVSSIIQLSQLDLVSSVLKLSKSF